MMENEGMRIDKYLKTSRLIKRREIAKEACEGGRVSVNGKIAKPGTEVKIGDQIEIRLGSRAVTVEVMELKDHVTKESATFMYKQLSSVRIESENLGDGNDAEEEDE